ncbi:hypothetical protein [Microbispora sp. H10830]|uniref:hypothetical protein n=1 Tax=Microbispora sp. H10830 TaxID=2729109 RepID=UPI00160296B5|nr:hypothetical protein [Microbispora sp. H10830]
MPENPEMLPDPKRRSAAMVERLTKVFGEAPMLRVTDRADDDVYGYEAGVR